MQYRRMNRKTGMTTLTHTPTKPKKKVLHEYTFDYIGVRTVKASSFEEASSMAEMEVPVNFTVELIETNDPIQEKKMGWKPRTGN